MRRRGREIRRLQSLAAGGESGGICGGHAAKRKSSIVNVQEALAVCQMLFCAHSLMPMSLLIKSKHSKSSVCRSIAISRPIKRLGGHCTNICVQIPYPVTSVK